MHPTQRAKTHPQYRYPFIINPATCNQHPTTAPNIPDTADPEDPLHHCGYDYILRILENVMCTATYTSPQQVATYIRSQAQSLHHNKVHTDRVAALSVYALAVFYNDCAKSVAPLHPNALCELCVGTASNLGVRTGNALREAHICLQQAFYNLCPEKYRYYWEVTYNDMCIPVSEAVVLNNTREHTDPFYAQVWQIFTEFTDDNPAYANKFNKAAEVQLTKEQNEKARQTAIAAAATARQRAAIDYREAVAAWSKECDAISVKVLELKQERKMVSKAIKDFRLSMGKQKILVKERLPSLTDKATQELLKDELEEYLQTCAEKIAQLQERSLELKDQSVRLNATKPKKPLKRDVVKLVTD